ncbi:nucleoside deaminase [Streptomyces sp. BI20]|uniref:nucleoside deaminase n=1 Tax=Streptomyces sp. BI20 TaxID=3403460 RepID=UPI003C7517FF
MTAFAPAELEALTPHVEHAVQISREHVAKGGIPFSGVVVQKGKVLGTGFNRVREDNDATAHAEVVALRNAAEKVGLVGVAGAVLIASGEPCALCYLAARHYGIQRVLYAADRKTAAAYGFDYSGSYRMFATDPTQWPGQVGHLPVEGHELPFHEFLTRENGRLR